MLFRSLKLGEYVSYTPNLTSYTITKEDTELKSDQIIKPNELNLWRVIRKNDDGTVDLVSEYASKNQVSFDANTLYFSGIGILNKIAKAYESSTYTTGSRHMGYDGFVVESCGDPCSADNGYEIDVGLVEKAIGTLNSKGFNSGIDYYLASRGGSFKNMHYTTYEARMIANGVVYNMGDLNSYGCGSSPCVGVVRARIRPVVVLKSTLKITGGNGTEESPWTLGI